MTGCRACLQLIIPGADDYLPEFENEIYRYAVKTQSNGEKIGYIVGLTELGQSQTELILPEKIDDVRIVGFGYERKDNGWYYERTGSFTSEKLTRLYVPFNSKGMTWAIDYHQGSCDNCYIVMWKDFRIGARFKGDIIGYNLLAEYLDYYSSASSYISESLLANVSYMYNYEDAEDEGYYWVDSYNNSLIGFIPPAPEREGYAFGGWYKEPQCENAWDFETDKTGNEIVLRSTNIEKYDVQDIMYLYAKWIKN